MTSQRVVFRADASLRIGTGHVMRCLTLADALRGQGAECQFICRKHPGNLIEFIRSKGYFAHALPVLDDPPSNPQARNADAPAVELAHGHWLGATQVQDAEACAPILAEFNPRWLIVDHYAIDFRWEAALKPHYRKLMVIDDLADRAHACDVLLDQTFGREAGDYQPWVPAHCQLLCGSQYALLRPEFAALRPYSLQRRAEWQFRRLLIAMGGVDKDNVTGQVLEALTGCSLPAACEITVVIGRTAPWLADVEAQAHQMPWPTTVRVGVSDMAQLMADSDLAIGAAGATSWERCCLGLPTIMYPLADNQLEVARGLEAAGAAWIVGATRSPSPQPSTLIAQLLDEPTALRAASQSARSIVDGRGTEIVASFLEV